MGGRAWFAMALFSPRIEVMQRHFGLGTAFVMEFRELIVAEILDRGEFILGALHRQYQFGKFELDGDDVAVLSILDQEQTPSER